MATSGFKPDATYTRTNPLSAAGKRQTISCGYAPGFFLAHFALAARGDIVALRQIDDR
jgi:hypothetical protein